MRDREVERMRDKERETKRRVFDTYKMQRNTVRPDQKRPLEKELGVVFRVLAMFTGGPRKKVNRSMAD